MYRCSKPIKFLLLVLLAVSMFANPACAADAPDVKDEGGMFEQAIASIINAIVSVFQTLEETAQFKTLDVLVFNEGISAEDKETLPFSKLEWDKLILWYGGMAVATGGFALIAVIFTAYKLMLAGAINPQSRREAMDSMWRWLWAVVLIVGAPAIFYIVFQLNTGLVESLIRVATPIASSNVGDMSRLGLSGEDSLIGTIITGSVLGTALVKLIFCGIECWFNVIYILRHFALMAIYVFTPLMAWMWALNKNVNAMPIWFGELISNAFMQSAHALCLLLFLTFCTVEDGKSWLILLVWMYCVIPLSEMIRNSVQGLFTRMSGFDEAGTATKVFGAMGLGSLTGMGNLIKTATPIKTAPIKPPPQGVNQGGQGLPAGAPSNNHANTSMPLGVAQNSSFNAGGQGIPGGGATNQFGTASPPTGHTTTQNGLFVPSSTQQNDNSNSTQTPTGANSPPLGMVRAANAARIAGTTMGTAAGLATGIMFSAVPGGQNVAKLAARGVGSATSAVTAMAGVGVQTGYQSYKSYKETGQANIGENYKNVTGNESIKGATLNTAALGANEGLTPVIGQHNANIIAPNPVSQTNKQPPSIDNYRWRN